MEKLIIASDAFVACPAHAESDATDVIMVLFDFNISILAVHFDA